jgi:hypothetical protein
MFSASKTAAVVNNAVNYIEDVFSTYLYTGTSASQTITNGIDLSTKGGLVWNKLRAGDGVNAQNKLYDTARGVNKEIYSNLTSAQGTKTDALNAFNANGFTLGAQDINETGGTYASWTFRKQPKFFDVVPYTGDGISGRAISHNLGSVPACIIVKNITTAGTDWIVYHRNNGTTAKIAILNSTQAAFDNSGSWFGDGSSVVSPTSTNFTVDNRSQLNGSGSNYVAYLFAHDAGGFGLTGTDNVISCGSMAGAAGTTVTLGYEPQFVMYKASTTTGNWIIADTMRGFTANGSVVPLRANLSDAETAGVSIIAPNATGFSVTGNLTSGQTYIYIAIRRGPMKVPTSGTSVFSPITTNTTAGTKQTTSFAIDAQIFRGRRTIATGTAAGTFVVDRLRGISTNATPKDGGLETNLTVAENDSLYDLSLFWDNTGFQVTSFTDLESAVWWSFRRAPSFMDVVCYTGTGSARTVSHNLGVVPEMLIVKSRSNVANWPVYHSAMGNTFSVNLNGNGAKSEVTFWNDTSPTASVFSVDDSGAVNGSGQTYVAYLFATCAGVSKVGSYTGTGTTLQIDCGFTAGARFVLIRRTSTGGGDPYVWDSARGIVSGNDPYLLLNSTAAEVTNTDYIDTYSAGFEISSTAPAAINASGGTFIFLAIA